jgi:hypothetical protein
MSQSLQCATCRNYEGAQECPAFPGKKIPTRIMTGRFDHRKPWPTSAAPKDHGIRYKEDKT